MIRQKRKAALFGLIAKARRVVSFGAPYHHGLEAGSKEELIAALAYMRDPQAFLDEVMARNPQLTRVRR